MIKFKQQMGDYLIYNDKNGKSILFGSSDNASKFAVDFISGEEAKYYEFDCYAGGTTLDYNEFLLVQTNKGAYDKAYYDVKQGQWDNLNTYGAYTTLDNLKTSEINYLSWNDNDEEISFEVVYSRALELAETIEAVFGKVIDVLHFNGQSYTLHRKYQQSANRWFKTYEFSFKSRKFTDGAKKSVATGRLKSQAMQDDIIKGVDK